MPITRVHVVFILSTMAALAAPLATPRALAQSATAREHVGDRAPERPKTLECPKGARLRVQERSIWCAGTEGGFANATGPYYKMRSDGTVRSRCEYSEGRKHGVCFHWRADGSLEYLFEYERGGMTRQVVYFDAERGGGVYAETVCTTPKHPGKPWDGEERYWRSTGELRKVVTIRGGVTVETRHP
jgi:hypothetical protein